MSGHSHWSGIKHRKGLNDARRAGVFTKAARLITLAARQGGGKPDTNFSLRLAIDQARSVNMPKDNIERAIKRGTGELKDQAEIEEIIYEAYGPGNVAMLIKTATDNKNRTVAELKHALSKMGGKLASPGAVNFLFKPVGLISLAVPDGDDSYEMELQAIDAGAEDTLYADDTLAVFTLPADLQKVKESLEKKGFSVENAGLAYAPLQKMEIGADARLDYEKLLSALDDMDDVQEIYDNL